MKTSFRTFLFAVCCANVLLAQNSLSFFKNYFVKGDYVVAGAGTRGTGNNGIATAMISTGSFPADNDVVAAYLYWVTLEEANNSGATINFSNGSANFSITGTLIASRPVPRWSGFTRASVYRADLFPYMPFDRTTFRPLAGGTFTIQLKDSGNLNIAPSTEGVSMVVVYRSPSAPFRAISLYDGGFTLARSDAPFTLNIGGFYQASSVSPSAKVCYIVADGQPSDATGSNLDSVYFNGTQLGSPAQIAAMNVFTGSASGTPGGFWDNPTFDVSALVGPNAAQASTTSPYGSDALTFAAVAFSTTVQDTDGDGLLDVWETSGFMDMDGTFIDLPAMGANPNVKDLFVEIDWMDGVTHTHKPKQAALDLVTTAFANAGINVHFDVGQGGPFTGGNSVGQESLLAPNGTAWKFKTGGFAYVKAGVPGIAPPNFSYNRRHIFHYSLWAHQRPNYPATYPDPALQNQPNSASGVADLPGSDSMVTLGLWRHDNSSDDQVGTVQEQGGTLLHELGHNTGLRHGGGDNINCKPNYHSVMSYLFQTHGLQNNGGAITFDFSRQLLPSLDETSLNEPAGLGLSLNPQGGNPLYRARYYAPVLSGGSTRRCDGSQGLVSMARIDSPFNTGPIDWNNNLVNTDIGVNADTNFDGLFTTLNGFLDWAAVDLQQVSGGFAFSEGEIANGEIANGEIANGEIANGEIANGEIANSNGEIANGNEFDYISASTVNPPAPGNSLVSRTATGQIRLAWNPVTLAIVRRYQIFRYNTGAPVPTAFTFVTASGNPPPASFTDTTVTPGQSYNYFVKTVDEFGNVSIQSSNTVTVVAK